MAKLKLLKSIGHNTIHSFLSLMNYREDDYVISYLYNMAKEKGIDCIIIDIIGRCITPKVYEIPVIKQALNDLGKNFEWQLKNENLSLDDVLSATAKIVFDLKNPHIGASGQDIEKYDCNVRVVDKNEKVYEITVREWWR
jgi:hypothetical protein